MNLHRCASPPLLLLEVLDTKPTAEAVEATGSIDSTSVFPIVIAARGWLHSAPIRQTISECLRRRADTDKHLQAVHRYSCRIEVFEVA